jgi:hypothetical protein
MTSSPDLQECIAACRRCHDVCTQTISHCLEKGGHHAEPAHIRLMFDCVRICEVSADFMLRGSDLHHATCRACAEICEHCAEDCERMSDDDAMRECAETCRACASTCLEMSGHHQGGGHGTEDEPVESSETRSPSDGEFGEPGHDEIAALAQKLYEDDGRPAGQDQDYWFRAERVLRERFGQPHGAESA